MEKSPGVVSVISAFHMAPPAVTEVGSDGDAEHDKKRSQEFPSKIATLIYTGCARALRQKHAYQLALSKTKISSPGSELVCCLSCNAVAGVLKAIQKKSRFCHQHKEVARFHLYLKHLYSLIKKEARHEGTADVQRPAARSHAQFIKQKKFSAADRRNTRLFRKHK
jgi:hypothetical protein